jgi:hypothetical protein
MKVISLGWGVQSFTLAAMVALGELEPVDFAIHADTTWERSDTYAFASQWTSWLEGHGVKVITVDDHEQAQKVHTNKTDIPAFTAAEGVHGQLRRQCTGRWKITPMRRFIADEMERRGIKKTSGAVEQWLGISQDEWHRAKDSDVQYIKHRYPLLELKMTRGDCVTWLGNHSLPTPPKSACVFCPYHNRKAWQEMKRNGGQDWQTAIEVDTRIRDARPPYPLFVHPARIPLEEAVSIPEDHGMKQPGLFDQECDSGYCFL